VAEGPMSLEKLQRKIGARGSTLVAIFHACEAAGSSSTIRARSRTDSTSTAIDDIPAPGRRASGRAGDMGLTVVTRVDLRPSNTHVRKPVASLSFSPVLAGQISQVS